MTTKHVVADDRLGQLARKQWELNRRVLEGTLDVDDVVGDLQHLIDGHTFRLEEKLPIKISSRRYPVITNRAVPLIDLFALTNLRLPSGCKLDELIKGLVHNGPDDPSPIAIELRLASLASKQMPVAVDACERIVSSLGYAPANLWELFSWYSSNRSFMNLLRGRSTINVLGSKSYSLQLNLRVWPKIEIDNGLADPYLCVNGDLVIGSFSDTRQEYLLLKKLDE